MNETIGRLTVFFEPPFWVGVFERFGDGKLSAAKITFGAEPKDYEVWNFILQRYHTLKFSPSFSGEIIRSVGNPKRRQRDVKKQLQASGIGTKSQQALAAQRSESKILHKQAGREQKDIEKQRRFDLKQQKRREKHRGH